MNFKKVFAVVCVSAFAVLLAFGQGDTGGGGTNPSLVSSGGGSGSPTTNATDITTGTLSDARLSANVPLLDRDVQSWTGDTNYWYGYMAFTNSPSASTFPAVQIGPGTFTRYTAGAGNRTMLSVNSPPNPWVGDLLTLGWGSTVAFNVTQGGALFANGTITIGTAGSSWQSDDFHLAHGVTAYLYNGSATASAKTIVAGGNATTGILHLKPSINIGAATFIIDSTGTSWGTNSTYKVISISGTAATLDFADTASGAASATLTGISLTPCYPGDASWVVGVPVDFTNKNAFVVFQPTGTNVGQATLYNFSGSNFDPPSATYRIPVIH